MPTGQEAPWRGRRTTRTSWAKYLPPNCAPMPSLLRRLEQPLLELEVAEGLAVARCPRSAARRSTWSTRASPSSWSGSAEVPPMTNARWYGGQAAVPRYFIFSTRNFSSFSGVSSALVSWKSMRLVGRAAALGDEEELVLGALGRVEVDLRRQVGAGVHLLVHVERDRLRVAQVLARCRSRRRPRDEALLVLHAGPDLLALLADDGGGAGVLAEGQLAARGDLGVLEQRERHALVVLRRLRDRRGSWPPARCARGAGRRRHSRIASFARRVSAAGSTFRTSLPSKVATETPSFVSRRYLVSSFPSGNGILVLERGGRHGVFSFAIARDRGRKKRAARCASREPGGRKETTGPARCRCVDAPARSPDLARTGPESRRAAHRPVASRGGYQVTSSVA